MNAYLRNLVVLHTGETRHGRRFSTRIYRLKLAWTWGRPTWAERLPIFRTWSMRYGRRMEVRLGTFVLRWDVEWLSGKAPTAHVNTQYRCPQCGFEAAHRAFKTRELGEREVGYDFEWHARQLFRRIGIEAPTRGGIALVAEFLRWHFGGCNGDRLGAFGEVEED